VVINNSATFQDIHDQAMRAAKLGHWLKAKEKLELALKKEPNSSECLYNLALIYEKLKEPQLAAHFYNACLEINPNFISAYINRGVLLHEQFKFDEALDSYNKAIALNPLIKDAWLNKANSLHSQGKYYDALKSYSEALEINPQCHDVLWNKSIVDLTLGQFSTGWDGYESRFKTKIGIIPLFQKTKRLDDVKRISGKKILVWHEQGYGDSIQFSRFLNLISTAGGKVVFYVPSPLLRIFKESFTFFCTDELKEIGKVDYQIPLLSIPRLFSIDPWTLSDQDAYLRTSDASVRDWRSKLNIQNGSKLNIGIAVSGSGLHSSNLLRSIQVESLSILDANFYLIQKNPDSSAIEWILTRKNCLNCSDFITDFYDSASIVQCMDLIISVDTSLAHLSGALGIKTILLLPKIPEWRWPRDSKRTPWYKSLVLFRQNKFNDWEEVIKSVKEYIHNIQMQANHLTP
jgi:tetratricopeptide (TPR) repeat protein